MESKSSEDMSKTEEDDYDDESIYIEIKREKPKMIYLENKIYEKLIQQIEKYNEMIKNIKLNSSKENQEIKILSNTDKNEIEKTINEKDKAINFLRNENESKTKEIISLKEINQVLDKKYNNLIDKYSQDMEEKNKVINSIKAELKAITDKYNKSVGSKNCLHN